MFLNLSSRCLLLAPSFSLILHFSRYKYPLNSASALVSSHFVAQLEGAWLGVFEERLGRGDNKVFKKRAIKATAQVILGDYRFIHLATIWIFWC
jgi:hypothetical protein